MARLAVEVLGVATCRCGAEAVETWVCAEVVTTWECVVAVTWACAEVVGSPEEGTTKKDSLKRTTRSLTTSEPKVRPRDWNEAKRAKRKKWSV